MPDDFEYVSQSRLEYRDGYRHAYLGEVPEPGGLRRPGRAARVLRRRRRARRSPPPSTTSSPPSPAECTARCAAPWQGARSRSTVTATPPPSRAASSGIGKTIRIKSIHMHYELAVPAESREATERALDAAPAGLPGAPERAGRHRRHLGGPGPGRRRGRDLPEPERVAALKFLTGAAATRYRGRGVGRRCAARSVGTRIRPRRSSASSAAIACPRPARPAAAPCPRAPGSAWTAARRSGPPDATPRPPRPRPTPRGTWPRRSSPRAPPSRASASRSPCSSATWCARPRWPSELGAEGMHDAAQPLLRDGARRGPPLRGHDQPVPRRRVHGALRRAASPTRTMRAARCWPPSASGARCEEQPLEHRPGRPVPLSLRMGLHTGFVVVGAIGDNLRMDYTAVGDTTHLAARLQQMAEPGAHPGERGHRPARARLRAPRARGAVEVRGLARPCTVAPR